MSKESKNRKPLVVGIIAVVVLLAALLALFLTQCGGPRSDGETQQPTATTAAPVSNTADYTLYWNLDRDLYFGKSEAGLSSRPMAEDGYFHFRFHCGGEYVELKTVDRKLVNQIDSAYLMGLTLDENGEITGVLELEDMPLQQVGWQFYVKSVGGNIIKVNSSNNFAGMEILLETGEHTLGIWDMTGLSGEPGCEAQPGYLDRIMAVANEEGDLTHVYIYDRSYYMPTHEAECQHCGEVVTWYEWRRTDELPVDTGHYQLCNDIQLKGQMSMLSDAKICLDLNGFTVTGKDNTRLYSIHNPGTTLALMDTSEAQTGQMVGHSTSSPQGGVVWVRYGAFYLYGGTLDGSDMTSRLNGTVVQVASNSYFYMHGGTIIGGTAAPQYDKSAGKYTYGLGGSVQVSGTMRMYGGTIRDGKAPAAYYYSGGKLTVSRGMGGNIFLSSGAVLEITGGEILYGYAGNVGGNIMMDGTAELIISGGSISGAWTDCRVSGKHGANVYCPSKSTITMSGGIIEGGYSTTAGGGNLYLLGTMTMTGGCVFSGKAAASGGNIQMGGSGKLIMYAGSIWGGVSGNGGGNINLSSKASVYMYNGSITGGTAAVSGGNICCDSSGSFNLYGGIIADGVCSGTAAGNGGGNIAVTANSFTLNIYGGSVTGGTATGVVNEDGTTAGGDGGNINLNKGTMYIEGGTVSGGTATGNGGGIYVGWNAVGMTLTQKALICGNTGTDICRSANTAEGKSQVILGNWVGNGENGALVIDRLEAVAGSVLVTPAEGVTLTEADTAKFSGTRFVLPIALSEEGSLILSAKADLGEGDHFHCICGGGLESSEGHTCSDVGYVSVTAEEFQQCWIANGANYDLAGSLNLCLTEDITLSAEYRLMGATLNLCLNGHTVTMSGNGRITANGESGVLNITDCGSTGNITAAEDCRSSILYTYKGSLSIYGGTVDASLCEAGNGGAVCVGYDGDSFTLLGGTVIGSKNAKNGGAITTSGKTYTATVTIAGGTVIGGNASTSGGAIYMSDGALILTGGTVTGGTAADGSGGIYLGWNADPLKLSGTALIYGNTGSDIYLGSNTTDYISLGTWTGNGENGALVIGKLNGADGVLLVSPAEGVVLTEETAALFASADDTMVIVLRDGNLVCKALHIHCICGGTLKDTEGHTCEDLLFTEIDSTEAFTALFNTNRELTASVNICLTGDVALDTEYKLTGNTLNLCLNGHTITMSGNGRITANGESGVLNITDCGATGNITAAENCRSSILYTYKGSLNIYGGTVDASLCKAGNGGAIFVGYSNDSFTLYGGTVIGSKSAKNGGAIYTTSKCTGITVTIAGGTVMGGYATTSGGSIYMTTGTLNLTGGTVTGGEAADGSGGIYAAWNCVAVNLSGNALIYGNIGSDIYLGSNTTNYVTLNAWTGNGENGALVIGKLSGKAGSVLAVPASGLTLTEADAARFASANEGLTVVLSSDGKLVLAN